MTEASFFWFDYETFGTHPAWDRPCQFAGIRTNENLEPVSDPLVLFCRQTEDYLPQPEACRVTQLSPQQVNRQGISEADFIGQIRRQMITANTCSVGYNNVRFDDEFTRHTLFRNLYDPYEQEWKNACSRWDLLDVVRLTRALRPEGIHWPVNEDGTQSNRLEHLTASNQIEHQFAHDAMSDVWATLSVARLIKSKQPKLYNYAFNNRSKHAVARLLDPFRPAPCLQVSGMIPGNRSHISPVLPLAKHSQNANSIIVLDLHADESEIATLTAEEIERRLFMTVDERERLGIKRPGIRTIQINKCPVVVPLSAIRDSDRDRLSLYPDAIKQRAQQVAEWLSPDTLKNIKTALMLEPTGSQDQDVEGSLYSGGFIKGEDRQRLDAIIQNPKTAHQHIGYFDDRRLDQLVFRYLARNFPDILSTSQQQDWYAHCDAKLRLKGEKWLDYESFRQALADQTNWGSASGLHAELLSYGEQLQKLNEERLNNPTLPTS